MSFKSFLLAFFIVFLFFLTPFNCLAESVDDISVGTTIDNTSIIATDSSTENTSSGLSLWDQIWNWITGVFIKNNYVIKQRDYSQKITEMTNYESEVSSAGTRLTSSASQICFKGNVLKKTIEGDYSDSSISHICVDSGNCSVSTDSNCQEIKITDLVHYFVQLNQNFYCDDQNNLKEIESKIIDQTNDKFSKSIPENELSCYQAIYDDLYLVPKNKIVNEENSRNIIKTPIPANSQKNGDNTEDIQNQLNQNFSPYGTSYGLNGLRPESEK